MYLYSDYTGTPSLLTKSVTISNILCCGVTSRIAGDRHKKTATETRSQRVQSHVDHVYCVTTDGGSNEIACRKMAAMLFSDLENAWYLEATCFEHSHHLVTMGSLQLVDKLLKQHGHRNWRYYSSVAIFTNVVRTQAKQLYHWWTETWGAASAQQTVKKMFPRCCSTRWGSVHTSEERIIQAGCERLYCALSHLFGKIADPVKELPNDLNPDALAVEAIREFQIKMSKWRKHTITVLGDPLFASCVKLMNKAREPVMHLSFFLKKRLTEKEVDTHGGHLAMLVNYKAVEIFEGFNEAMRPPTEI